MSLPIQFTCGICCEENLKSSTAIFCSECNNSVCASCDNKWLGTCPHCRASKVSKSAKSVINCSRSQCENTSDKRPCARCSKCRLSICTEHGSFCDLCHTTMCYQCYLTVDNTEKEEFQREFLNICNNEICCNRPWYCQTCIRKGELEQLLLRAVKMLLNNIYCSISSDKMDLVRKEFELLGQKGTDSFMKIAFKIYKEDTMILY